MGVPEEGETQSLGDLDTACNREPVQIPEAAEYLNEPDIATLFREMMLESVWKSLVHKGFGCICFV